MNIEKKTDLEKLADALAEMVLEPLCKINKGAVAKRAGVNNAILYRKSDAAKMLKGKVEEAEKKRAIELEAIDLNKKVAKLTKQVENLKAVKAVVTNEKDDDGKWMAHLTQMYSMNDQMKATNSDLSNKLLHGFDTEVIHVDSETGEVIEGVFDKENE